MSNKLSDKRSTLVNKKPQNQEPQADEYDEMLVTSLLEILRIEDQLTLDKFTRSELAREGLPAADLRRAINIAGSRQRIRTFAQNGVPCVALAESERAA